MALCFSQYIATAVLAGQTNEIPVRVTYLFSFPFPFLDVALMAGSTKQTSKHRASVC